MPLYDYRCRTCEALLEDVVVLPHQDEPTECECGGALAKNVVVPLPARMGSRRSSRSGDTSRMWGPEHVARLRTGDVEATREVHYDVMRRSGMSAEAATHHAQKSAPEGVATTAKHLSGTTAEQRDPSNLKPNTVVADG